MVNSKKLEFSYVPFKDKIHMILYRSVRALVFLLGIFITAKYIIKEGLIFISYIVKGYEPEWYLFPTVLSVCIGFIAVYFCAMRVYNNISWVWFLCTNKIYRVINTESFVTKDYVEHYNKFYDIVDELNKALKKTEELDKIHKE